MNVYSTVVKLDAEAVMDKHCTSLILEENCLDLIRVYCGHRDEMA